MPIAKLTTLLALVALTAGPSFAAVHHKKHGFRRSVNGATSIQPANGTRKTTRSGGPAGGTSNQ